MALFHPKLSPSFILPLPRHSQCLPRKPLMHLSSALFPLARLGYPVLEPPLSKFTGSQDKLHLGKNDFYLNLGAAVRTLRDDLPSLFYKDLNYDIYREDIIFADPLNTFQGMENYRLIFWALRFHGRILFKEIGVEVFRVWQPSENSIWIRWEIRGVPRVPWDAKGRFQGTSRYKVDRKGKIYEHKVDNLAFYFPRNVARTASVLNFVAAACPPSINLTFWGDPYEESGSSSWLQLYRAVSGTLVHEEQFQLLEGVMA